MSLQPKIAIVGSAGVPAKYGGLEMLTQQLIPHLNDSYQLTVYCSAPYYSSNDKRPSEWEKARLVYLPFLPTGIQGRIYRGLSILHACWTQDLILLLGVRGSIFLSLIKLITRTKILLHVDELRWKKEKSGSIIRKIVQTTQERIGIQLAQQIVTNNQAIASYLEEEYQVTSKVIPLAGTHAKKISLSSEIKEKHPFLSKRYALSVSRIAPYNHTDMILQAFARYPKYELVIIGDWTQTSYSRKLKIDYEGYENIHMLNPIYDAGLFGQIRSQAHVFIHSQQVGGTPLALVEAMNLGLPTLAFDEKYNREAMKSEGLFFAHYRQIISHLETLNPSRHEEISHDLQKVAKSYYTWEEAGNFYQTLIDDCLNPQPKSVSKPAAVPATEEKAMATEFD